MLNREELIQTPIDFNLYQKEKDYLQHIVLSRVFSRTSSELTFKGGTAIQKCFGLNRFSEDLDFTASENLSREKLERSLEEMGRFYPCSVSKVENNVSLSYKLKIEGPLFHGPLSLQTIRIDISMREEILLTPIKRIVTPLYIDLQPYMVVFMEPREILSEKIRALMTRAKARDLYDLYYLSQKNVELDLHLASRKLEFYSLEFNRDILLERLGRLKSQWEKEIPGLVRNVPDFDLVISTLSEFIKA
ncbi:MAG: nucleotidyl transferase AbiEii/AbiGii toxin family protein [Candidatus Thermoplasmatota archaeon]|nr:nucleotidyl transferase AbiEii/AbiGii toxin family protein [Candidatus Thermoplasmatota archaeon]MDA8143437.1 nucleotidyl transferase AbiEii/AbiGii toxin family protein [Thermoplasmatales archaeon]